MRRGILLNVDEMDTLIEEIGHILMKANRMGELDSLLSSWGLEEFCEVETYKTSPKGKILVIGDTKLHADVLLGIGKSLGLNENRFELCLDYKEAKTFNYKKLKYNPYNYSVVLFGAVPHSSTGKNCSGSVVSEMQTQEGYPKTIQLMAGSHMKITKSNFKATLENLLVNGDVEI